MQKDRAVWLQPGWRGRYRVAAGREAVVGVAYDMVGGPGGGSPGQEGVGRGTAGRWKRSRERKGGKASWVYAHFTRAALGPAPTTQGHRGQEVVYAFLEKMTLNAAEAIKMAPDEGAARMAVRTYHVHPHRGTRGIPRSRGRTASRV